MAASDMELGVVIGPVAQGVGADTAMDYVFGYTVCNDTSSPVFGQKTEPFGPLTGVRMGGVATGNKGADGCGPIGPVITTADEVGSPHDLTATARFNDRVRVRAHTGAYLYNVRDTVAHFAQLMTLPAGAIIGMGACGYDGHAVQGAWRHPERNVLAVEFERVGRLEHPISYLDDPAREGVGPQGRQSRYLARREQLGLGGADRPELTANDIPAATRSFWALSENVGSTPLHKLPAPYLYPASSLAGTAPALTLPRHARRLEVSCELAGVIGPRPVFRPAPADVPDLLLGVGVIVSVVDMSLVDSFPGVPTPGTARFAAYQCRYPDGCSRIGAIIPLAGGSDRLADATMTLRVGQMQAAPGRVGDYGVSVEAAVAWITSGITLLPGDVVSLGPSTATLTIPADEPLAAGTTLTAAIEGIGEIEVALMGQRDPSTDPWPWPLVPRG
jgi:2-keto-4-pentenoate hydratase/2-oxohepta-3-ene-1,7-dioic acid hydratase in catechol pathway